LLNASDIMGIRKRVK